MAEIFKEYNSLILCIDKTSPKGCFASQKYNILVKVYKKETK